MENSSLSRGVVFRSGNEGQPHEISSKNGKATMTSDKDEILLEIEERLAGTLKPIRPSKDVVLRLRERIRLPAREEITLRLQDWQRMFLVFGGVMSGMLALITIARALYYFVGRRHM
jgi:hypothetical protein